MVALVRVFYGLALASGLKAAIDNWIKSNNQGWTELILIAATLVIGVADWFGYHFFSALRTYKEWTRPLVDVLYPIAVFVLFYLVRELSLFLIGLFLYFGGWAIYNWRVQLDPPPSLDERRRYIRPSYLLPLIPSVGIVALAIGDRRSAWIGVVSVILGGVWWAWMNIDLMRLTLRVADVPPACDEAPSGVLR